MAVPPPSTYISTFSGIGALDDAVERVFPSARPLVYVENEPTNVLRLAARMEEGTRAPAPVWSDIGSLPVELFRGRADMVIGGFPCQDLSLAGKRGGIRGRRSGLFFALLRAIRHIRPRYLFLENVAAITVGRDLDAVSGALAEIGFDARWGCLRASDVGAPHGRDRWWCLAWDRRQLADSKRLAGDPGPERPGREAWSDVDGRSQGASVADPEHRRFSRRAQQDGREEQPELEAPRWNDALGCDPSVADAECDGVEQRRDAGDVASTACRARHEGLQRQRGGCPVGDSCAGDTGLAVGNATSGRREHREGRGPCGRVATARAGPRSSGELGNPERQGLALGGRVPGNAGEELAPTERAGDGLPLWPPGPADRDGWAAVLARHPELAPAAQSRFRGVVDGDTSRLNLCVCHRGDRLRGLGNAVVPACAEAALRLLWLDVFGEWP